MIRKCLGWYLEKTGEEYPANSIHLKKKEKKKAAAKFHLNNCEGIKLRANCRLHCGTALLLPPGPRNLRAESWLHVRAPLLPIQTSANNVPIAPPISKHVAPCPHSDSHCIPATASALPGAGCAATWRQLSFCHYAFQ